MDLLLQLGSTGSSLASAAASVSIEKLVLHDSRACLELQQHSKLITDMRLPEPLTPAQLMQLTAAAVTEPLGLNADVSDSDSSTHAHARLWATMVAALDQWAAKGPPRAHDIFLPWLQQERHRDHGPTETELLLMLRLGGYLCTPLEPLAFLVAQAEARSALAANSVQRDLSAQGRKPSSAAAEEPLASVLSDDDDERGASLAVRRVPGLLDSERAAANAVLRRVLGNVRGLRVGEVEAAVSGTDASRVDSASSTAGTFSLSGSGRREDRVLTVKRRTHIGALARFGHIDAVLRNIANALPRPSPFGDCDLYHDQAATLRLTFQQAALGNHRGLLQKLIQAVVKPQAEAKAWLRRGVLAEIGGEWDEDMSVTSGLDFDDDINLLVEPLREVLTVAAVNGDVALLDWLQKHSVKPGRPGYLQDITELMDHEYHFLELEVARLLDHPDVLSWFRKSGLDLSSGKWLLLGPDEITGPRQLQRMLDDGLIKSMQRPEDDTAVSGLLSFKLFLIVNTVLPEDPRELPPKWYPKKVCGEVIRPSALPQLQWLLGHVGDAAEEKKKLLQSLGARITKYLASAGSTVQGGQLQECQVELLVWAVEQGCPLTLELHGRKSTRKNVVQKLKRLQAQSITQLPSLADQLVSADALSEPFAPAEGTGASLFGQHQHADALPESVLPAVSSNGPDSGQQDDSLTCSNQKRRKRARRKY